MSTKPVFHPKKALTDQSHEVIMAHFLDPDNSPIPAEYQEQLHRVVSAAQMLDKFHPASVIPRLQAKYNVSYKKAWEDVNLAQDIFKSKHTFDYDYWQMWQIKDLIDIIRTCKFQQKHKERIAAHKVLKEIIGEKEVGVEDPKRMEKNVFYIQLNHNQTTVDVPLDKIKGMTPKEIQTIVEALTTNVTEDDDIVNLLNT